MKIAVKILKGILLFLTAIWGIFLGMLVPLSLIIVGDDMGLVPGFSRSAPVWLWFINSFVFHLGGTLMTMINKMKAAFFMAISGIIINFIVFHLMHQYYIGSGDTQATMLYMPQIFISILIICIAIITQYPEYIRKKELEDAKKAPSILAENSSAVTKKKVRKE